MGCGCGGNKNIKQTTSKSLAKKSLNTLKNTDTMDGKVKVTKKRELNGKIYEYTYYQ